MWVRGGHQFVLFPKGDKELSWHFQALLPTFVFFLLSQQQIVSLFSVLAEFYCTNYWGLLFSVSKSLKSRVLVNSIVTFFDVSISWSWEILSVDFASWEIFRKTRKKVTKKRFIVLSKKKILFILSFQNFRDEGHADLDPILDLWSKSHSRGMTQCD